MIRGFVFDAPTKPEIVARISVLRASLRSIPCTECAGTLRDVTEFRAEYPTAVCCSKEAK